MNAKQDLDELQSAISAVCNMLARDERPSRDVAAALLRHNFLKVFDKLEATERKLAEADRVVDAANVALGHFTGGMDGDWRDCDPAELLRDVLSDYEASKGVGDWKEDFTHENGNYENTCGHCGKSFIGHKRRVVCKACDNQPTNKE